MENESHWLFFIVLIIINAKVLMTHVPACFCSISTLLSIKLQFIDHSGH